MKVKETKELKRRVDSESDIITGSIILFMMIPVGVITNSLVLMNLWTWFIVPLGLPYINMTHSAGIIVTISLLKLGLQHAKPTSSNSIWDSVYWLFGLKIFIPFIILLIGFIIKQWM